MQGEHRSKKHERAAVSRLRAAFPPGACRAEE